MGFERNIPEHHLVATAALLLAPLVVWVLFEWYKAWRQSGTPTGPLLPFMERSARGATAGTMVGMVVVGCAFLSLEAPGMIQVFARYGLVHDLTYLPTAVAAAGLGIALFIAAPCSLIMAALSSRWPRWASPALGALVGSCLSIAIVSRSLVGAWWCGNSTPEEIAFTTLTTVAASVMAGGTAGFVGARGGLTMQ